MLSKKTIFFKDRITLTHLPTFLLIIGYVTFWTELYFIRSGRGITSFLGPGLFAVFFAFVIFRQRKRIFQLFMQGIDEYKKQHTFVKFFIFAAGSIVLIIIFIIFLALLLPPHLPQEFDALNYHLTLPRQHLIAGSFEHIRWSAADLFPLPIQFALAPYWLTQEIPSKFAQIFFVFGLLAVSLNLIRRFSSNSFLSLFIGLIAILGSHSVGIQMPILMLDIVIGYLFIASIDSFLEKKILLGAVEFSFFIWSKSFYLPQMLVIIIIMLLLRYLLKKARFKEISWCFEKRNYGNLICNKIFRKAVSYTFFVSIFVGGPFVAKSLYYAGTPLFPFYPGLIKSQHIDQSSSHWQSILSSSQRHFSTKDAYGSGRSLFEFMRHLWLVAVPEEGVVNRYDYPLGLPYLLFLGPFLYFLVKAMREKRFVILPFLAVSYWLTWWFGSQQARFLYIPLILIFITVAAKMKKPTNLFMASLIFSLIINSVSIFRAHFNDIGRSSAEVLREKDKRLLLMNKNYFRNDRKDIVVLDYYDAAYANFPIKVICKNDYWVLQD